MSPTSFNIDKGIIKLQSKLSLHDSFFGDLLEEDDWSFIIKLHALIEAACGSLILYHFEEPKLANIISRLELSNKTTGKVAILKELELLGSSHRRYISALSELRNTFVHNVQNCNINLSQFIQELDKNQLKKFAFDFNPQATLLQSFANVKGMLNEEDLKEIEPTFVINKIQKDPKLQIWIGAYNLLTFLVDMEGYSDYLKSEKASKYLNDSDDDEE